MRRWGCLLWICLAFHQVYVSHIQHVIENSSFCTTHKSSVSTGLIKSKSKWHCGWRSVSESVSLGVEPHLGPMSRYLFLSDSYVLVSVGRPLWREDVFVFFMCRWPLPAQLFSGPSPLRLATEFYCLRFEISLFVASYDSQGHDGGIRPRHNTGSTRVESESESYITTDGQSASLSWNKAPIWGLRPDFYHCRTVAGLLMCGALSLMRGRVCRLQLLLALASAVIFGSASFGTRDRILLSQNWDFPFRRLLRLAGSR
jgi:hypothetical protein